MINLLILGLITIVWFALIARQDIKNKKLSDEIFHSKRSVLKLTESILILNIKLEKTDEKIKEIEKLISKRKK